MTLLQHKRAQKELWVAYLRKVKEYSARHKLMDEDGDIHELVAEMDGHVAIYRKESQELFNQLCPEDKLIFKLSQV